MLALEPSRGSFTIFESDRMKRDPSAGKVTSCQHKLAGGSTTVSFNSWRHPRRKEG